MDIVQLTEVMGNVGEFVGSFAVLATLIYLSLQVSHSKGVLEKQSEALTQSIEIAKATAETDMLSRNINWFSSIVENQHVAVIVGKLKDNECLDETETQQAQAMFSQLTQLWLTSLLYHEKGLISDEIMHGQAIAAPKGVAKNLPGFLPFFAAAVEGNLFHDSKARQALHQTYQEILKEHEYG